MAASAYSLYTVTVLGLVRGRLGETPRKESCETRFIACLCV